MCQFVSLRWCIVHPQHAAPKLSDARSMGLFGGSSLLAGWVRSAVVHSSATSVFLLQVSGICLPLSLQSVNPMPGMVPIVKRAATIDGKSGIPVYQPTAGSTSAYQQALAAMQLQPQPYVPAVTSESSLLTTVCSATVF